MAVPQTRLWNNLYPWVNHPSFFFSLFAVAYQLDGRAKGMVWRKRAAVSARAQWNVWTDDAQVWRKSEVTSTHVHSPQVVQIPNLVWKRLMRVADGILMHGMESGQRQVCLPLSWCTRKNDEPLIDSAVISRVEDQTRNRKSWVQIPTHPWNSLANRSSVWLTTQSHCEDHPEHLGGEEDTNTARRRRDKRKVSPHTMHNQHVAFTTPGWPRS